MKFILLTLWQGLVIYSAYNLGQWSKIEYYRTQGYNDALLDSQLKLLTIKNFDCYLELQDLYKKEEK